MPPESDFRVAPNWPQMEKMVVMSQFSNMMSPSSFHAILLFLSVLVTVQSFMSASSLVLEFWQFSFIRDWAEIRKSEKPSSEICPKSGDWGKLGIPSLAQISLIKCYRMPGVIASTFSEVLRENRQEGG